MPKVKMKVNMIEASVDAVNRIANKQSAIDTEVKALFNAIEKAEIASFLLPRIAKKYAAAEVSNEGRLGPFFHEFCYPDVFYIANNGEEIKDCVMEVVVTGKKGDTGKSVFLSND